MNFKVELEWIFSFASPDYSLYPFPLWRPITFIPRLLCPLASGWGQQMGVDSRRLKSGKSKVRVFILMASSLLFLQTDRILLTKSTAFLSHSAPISVATLQALIITPSSASTLSLIIIALHYCYTQPCLYLVYISFIKPSSNTPEINVFHFLPWSVWYNESQWSSQCLYYKHQFGFSKATSSVTLK